MTQRAEAPVRSVLCARFGRRYMTVLEGHRTDAQLMAEISEERIRQDEIDDEIRNPESSISLGYCVIAGDRPFPTARYLVALDLLREAQSAGAAS